MRRQKQLLVIICVLITGIYLTGPAMGTDKSKQQIVYIEEHIKNTDNRTVITKHSFYGKDNVLLTDSSWPFVVLIQFSEEKVYFINYTQRNYSSMLLPQFIEESKKALGEFTQQDIVIVKTDKSKKIGNYSCDRYLMQHKQANLKTESWVAPGIKEIDLTHYYNASLKLGGQPINNSLIQLLQKIKGYSIESHTDITDNSGVKSIVQKVNRLENRLVPGEFFSLQYALNHRSVK